MASQTTKIIDVTRGFVPVDPDAFPETMHISSKEDGAEKAKEVVIYEGYNFLPTSYGYKSYFGTTSKLNIDALTSNVDYLLILQSSFFVNIAVALCDDGIWTKRADSTGAWTHEVSLPVPDEGVHYDWSYCFIDNDFFAYRASSPSYYRFSNVPKVVTAGEIASALPVVVDPLTSHPANAFYSVTPAFLNMEGQIGIFKAGSRLGFWDSANSIAWSSIDDYAEFTPAVLTMAGSAVFSEVQGRITNILDMADGFVVYSTKSITLIARDDSGTMQWNPLVLIKDAGVAFKREVCKGGTTLTQFAYTSKGLVKVEGSKADTIVEEIGDFLKESTQPVFLALVENRYLFLEILDNSYIDGLVSFTVKTLPTEVLAFPSSNIVYDPLQAEYVAGIFSGENAELQAQLQQYVLDNSMPPMATTGLPIYDASINNAPAFQPIFVGAPAWVKGEWGMRAEGTFGNSLTQVWSSEPYVASPPLPNSLSEIVYPISVAGYGQVLMFLTAGSIYAPFNTVPQITAGVDSSTGVVLGFEAWYSTQLTSWETNDINDIAVLNNILQYTASYSVGSQIDNRYELQVYLRDFRSVAQPVLTTTLRCDVLPTIKKKTIGTFNSKWSIPALSISGNTVRITRRRTAVVGIQGRLELAQEGLSVNARVKMQGAELSTEHLESNPLQEAVATITEYEYTDSFGNLRYIPASAITLPEIAPFYYTDPGSITYPPVSFLLQDGSIGPVYPTIPGALVYDLQLKKWGKMKMDYKVLVDWQPLNNLSGNTIPYETFGMQGGVLKADGTISLFDKYPVDSYIKYGKIGYYRQGFTSAEEVRASMRDLSTCTVRTEASLDGTTVELGLTKLETFTNVRNIVMYPSTSARWHTISFIGIYDIKHLEFRGTIVGNR